MATERDVSGGNDLEQHIIKRLTFENLEQRGILGGLEKGQIPPPDQYQEFFSWYSKSDFLKKVTEGIRGSRAELIGSVFENIAFIGMAVKSGKTVLSPRETVGVFGKLFPSVQRHLFPFGRESLHGIYVPDGLIIDGEGNIESELEYTCARNPDHSIYEKRIIALRRRIRYMRDKGFTESTNFLLVVPRPHRDSADPYKSIPDITLAELPFDRRVFAQFVNPLADAVSLRRGSWR
jgi:hypothetical protein